MTVSQRLRKAARPIWDRCLTHPFVAGIGDGTLPAEKFQYFMLQDYLYLFDYARVFALGVVKAREAALMRVFARNVDAILGGEMNIHRAYMERLGISEEQVLAVKPALGPWRSRRPFWPAPGATRRSAGPWPRFPGRRSTPFTASGFKAMPRRTITLQTRPSLT